jgi:hypothetical protein
LQAAATEDDDEKAGIIVKAFLVLSPFFKMHFPRSFRTRAPLARSLLIGSLMRRIPLQVRALRGQLHHGPAVHRQGARHEASHC